MELNNKKAYYEYFFEATYTAGLVLAGTEIKSLRNGKASFNDSYCIFEKGELFVKSLHISEYKFGTYANHAPLQERKLLLNKKELIKLQEKTKEKETQLSKLTNSWNTMSTVSCACLETLCWATLFSRKNGVVLFPPLISAE